jgi:ATP-dependent DNA helicase RecQ
MVLDQARRILKTVFGYDDFIFLQERVLENVLERRDTLAVMPTGGGKSVCYQIPALLWDGLTVVVSPLISLMKDQVDQLRTLGVPAVMLNSSLTEEQYRSNVAGVRAGRARIVYLAPETARHPAVMDLLRSCRVELLAIDEAHCISEWGPDFRPEYRRLSELRDTFPDAVCLALTATATPRVRRDILECLRMSSAAEVVAGFNRENLFLKVDYKVDPLGQVLGVIGRFPGDSGIIYCHTRRRVDSLCRSLQDRGIPAAAYHAGLDDAQRRRAQELFVGDEIRVMVATVAFGMGIDKSNVRYVVHYDLPKNLEGYYQEIGRSGRDGLPAECVLLFSYADAAGRRRLIQRLEDPLLRRAAAAQLDAMVRFAETESCRRIPLLGYFGERAPEGSCGMCDNCREPERPALDVTVPAQKLLSCVVRTGQRFGAGHVVSVLCGSKTKRILENRHHQLSTYGIGTEFSPRGWRSLAECLTWRGLLERDPEFGALRLTRKGWEVLRSRHPIRVRWHPPEEAVPGQAADADAEEAVFSRELFERLRGKRREWARSLGVPPYVIFSDRSLADMAARMPQTREEMLAVHGVGEGKLERFGEDFLSVIREFRREHPDVQPIPAAPSPARKSRPSDPTGRHHQVAKAFNRGRSLDDLSRDFGIRKRTVIGHLRRYQMEGGALREEGLLEAVEVPDAVRRQVDEAFDRLGCDFLRPVHDALDGQVDYDRLSLLRLLYVNRRIREGEGAGAPGGAAQGTVTFVCLANSRKYAGRCIAGKLWDGRGPGPWIRPVGPGPTGELDPEALHYDDGEPIRLLDLVRAPVGGPCGPAHQPENRLLGDGPLRRLGNFPPDRVEELCDPVETLWIIGNSSFAGVNDRMSLDQTTQAPAGSLLFIEPDSLAFRIALNSKGLKKVWAEFFFRGIPYRLSVTDPAVEAALLDRDPGVFPVPGRVFVTVSLSEPFEGHIYKLAAAVVRTASRREERK